MRYPLIIAACMLWMLAAPARAGNVTIATYISEDDPFMRGTQAHCNVNGFYHHKVFNGMQVSVSGDYLVADVGGFLYQGLDAIVGIYQGSFNPNQSSANLVGLYDYGDRNYIDDERMVSLVAGQTYSVVISNFCGGDDPPDKRPSAVVVRGPGNISGVGFETPSSYYGDFSQVSDSANFAEWGGVRKYATWSFTAPRPGVYHFTEFGGFAWDGSPSPHRLYSKPFNPEKPDDNLLWGQPQESVPWYLGAGETIYVVIADYFQNNSIFQVSVFNPGELDGINRAITGTYRNREKSGQGILLEADYELNLMFLALFTYEAETGSQLADGIGSSDQRWLSAFGSYDPESLTVKLKWENTTGGSFNAAKPKAERDENYGSGELTFVDCNHIEITYELPDVPPGKFEMERLLPGNGQTCYELLPPGLPEP